MALCSIKNLSKTYPAFELSDISFELKPGRITGFIGRNGAGKTTAIKSVLGLVHPDCGEVHFFSLPFSKNERQIKQRIGFSTGSVNYYHKKKIKNIVSVTKSFYQNWDEEAYKEYLNLFALDENKAPYELSEGMKVKFNLLLALSHRAEVLILDEPTSGLDPFSRDEKCADDILYIRNGKIVSHCSKDVFRKNHCAAGETIEESILRMERESKICSNC